MIIVCDRSLWQHLQAVDDPTMKQELQPYLDGGQISALCKRRRRLLRHLERLIKQKSEDQVLFDLERYKVEAAPS